MAQMGIIAEEQNDIDVISEFTVKILGRSISFKKFIGHGCGAIKRKCASWARNLIKKGCTHLIVLHDLDNSSEQELRNDLTKHVKDVKFTAYIILIPIFEIEAWLLCDPEALKRVFSMAKLPKLPGKPETIIDPKKRLEDIIWKGSKRRYINTIHNQKIANNIQISLLTEKCSSFSDYPKFIKNI